MNESSEVGGSRIGEQLRMLATIAEQVDRLESENRRLSEERDRLRGALTETETRLSEVSGERDQLAEALTTARHELTLFAEREAAWQAEAAQTAQVLRALAERLAGAPTPSSSAAAPSPPPAAPEEPARPAAEPAAPTPATAPVAATEAAPAPTGALLASEATEPAAVTPEPAAATTPEPAATATPEAAAATTPEPAPPPSVTETYELAASPFSSFSTLIAFQKAVAGLPGVEDVRTKSFLNGALVLSLRYSGRDPLTASLSRLPGFRAERLSAIGNRIEFVVATDLAPR